jgi:hypothetical protein
MQINIAFASFFQISDAGLCPIVDNESWDDASASESKDLFASASYRGTSVVPFFANRTTFAELYSGLEYRLNKYSQVHTRRTTSTSKVTSTGATTSSMIEPQRSVLPSALPPLDPLFDTYCPHCKRNMKLGNIYTMHDASTCEQLVRESDVNLEDAEYCATSTPVGTVSTFPAISVVSVRRRLALSADVPDERLLRDTWQQAVQRGEKDIWRTPYCLSDMLVMPRDAQSILSDEVMHFNVFFQCHMVEAASASSHEDLDAHGGHRDKNSAPDRPIITANGMIHRSACSSLGIDHCPQFICEPKPVEVAVRVAPTKPPLRFRFPDLHTVRDLVIRLEQTCGGRVGRVVDTETGAAVLPCEVLGHVVWKLRNRMAVEWFPFPSLVPPKLNNGGVAFACSDATGTTQPNATQILTLEFLRDDDDDDDEVEVAVHSDDDSELALMGLHEYSHDAGSGKGVVIGGSSASIARKRPRHEPFDRKESLSDNGEVEEETFITMSDDDNEMIYMDDYSDASNGNDTITMGGSEHASGSESQKGDHTSNASTFRLMPHSATAAMKSTKTRQPRCCADDDASIRISEFGGHESADEQCQLMRGVMAEGSHDDGDDDTSPFVTLDFQEAGWMSDAAPMRRRVGTFADGDDDEDDEECAELFMIATQPIEYAKIHMAGLGGDEDDDEDE